MKTLRPSVTLSHGKDGFRAPLEVEVRVIDAKKFQVEYVASDATLDSYREVIQPEGWRFDLFKKNAPLVDSHNYYGTEYLLGKVINFEVRKVGERKCLVETAQFAADVETNERAINAWKMTEAGYLRAVSVGFVPVRYVSRWDSNPTAYNQEIGKLELKPDDKDCPRTIYMEQQQIELSVCILGANPNALAKAYEDGVVPRSFIESLSTEQTTRNTDRSAADAADAERSRQQQRRESTERTRFLERFERALKTINS